MYPDEQADQPTQSSGPASPSQFAAPPAPYLGVIVQNRYQIEKEIGHGGFGVVYLARDLQLLSKPVVVKVLRLPSAAETWRRKKFREEIEALTRIDHPGVVTVLDAGEMPDGSPYLVMQFVEGVPLRKLIPRDGMDLARAAELIRQAGAALNAAHEKGVIHRDLKPENILVQPLAGDDEIVKLIDFGVATVFHTPDTLQSVTTEVAGSLPYMAPEQMMGRPSRLSDVYSLGAVAYEMVTGRTPFSPEPSAVIYYMQSQGKIVKPRDLRRSLPEEAEALILHALAFEPRNRPTQVRNFARDLARALVQREAAGATTQAQPAEPHLGRLVAKMCNRRAQEDEFKSFFLTHSEPASRRALFCVLHGPEGECHESLVERLLYQMERILERRPGRTQAGLSVKKIPWQYDGAVETRKHRLLCWLCDQFAPGRELRLEDLPAALGQAVATWPASFAVIQHDIRAARWDPLAKPFIEAYMRMWADILPPGSPAGVQIFLNIVYPAAETVESWKKWLRPGALLQTAAGKRLRQELTGLCAGNPRCPSLLLDELAPVTRDDVLEWFNLYNIYDSEALRLQKAERVFPSRQRAVCQSMAEIERQLREIHREFLSERGYA